MVFSVAGSSGQRPWVFCIQRIIRSQLSRSARFWVTSRVEWQAEQWPSTRFQPSSMINPLAGSICMPADTLTASAVAGPGATLAFFTEGAPLCGSEPQAASARQTVDTSTEGNSGTFVSKKRRYLTRRSNGLNCDAMAGVVEIALGVPCGHDHGLGTAFAVDRARPDLSLIHI